MLRMLVTGKEGQVVSCLKEAAEQETDIEVIALGRPDLDLLQPATILDAISSTRPDIVVSAAAYTAVDNAEDEPAIAFAVNATGAETVAKAASQIGAPVIHLSTDYVFDGYLDRPYVETDRTGPIGVYGASKLAGEIAVARENQHHLILRTAWVYSAFGKNFVKTMLNLARTRDEVDVVADQWGNPTSAHDIAAAIIHIARKLKAADPSPNWGTYHFAGTGDINWSGFARHIFEVSAMVGGPAARVKEIEASAFQSKAPRPTNSRLNVEKFSKVFGWVCEDWKTASAETAMRILRPDISATDNFGIFSGVSTK